MIETVLFDIGDTLLHSEIPKTRDILDTAARPAYDGLCEAGYDLPTYDVYLRKLRQGFRRAHLWSRISRREVRLMQVLDLSHRRMGVSIKTEHLEDTVQRCAQALHQHTVVDEHAVSIVSELGAAGLKLGLVSNTVFPGPPIDDMLESHGLLGYFAVRVYSSEARHFKPQARIFNLALRQLGATAARTLFVGDRPEKDVAGAARVGMRTALFARSNPVPSGRVRPDYLIRSLREIPIILNLSARGF